GERPAPIPEPVVRDSRNEREHRRRRRRRAGADEDGEYDQVDREAGGPDGDEPKSDAVMIEGLCENFASIVQSIPVGWSRPEGSPCTCRRGGSRATACRIRHGAAPPPRGPPGCTGFACLRRARPRPERAERPPAGA